MVLQRRLVLIAMAGAALCASACQDGTGPLPPAPTRYATAGVLRLINPKTHLLDIVASPTPTGISADVVVGSSSQSALLVANNAPGVAKMSGHIDYTYTDSLGHTNKMVFLYRPGGGPIASAYHFVDGKLAITYALTWVKISGGWYNSQILTRFVGKSGASAGDYSLVGTYTQTTQPCSRTVTSNCGPSQTVFNNHPAISPLQRALGGAALGLAYACFPADATAQAYFSQCSSQWRRYAGNSLVVIAGIMFAPETGGGSLLISAGAAMSLSADYSDLMSCMHLASGVASSGFGGAGAGAGGAAENSAGCDSGGLDCPVAYTE